MGFYEMFTWHQKKRMPIAIVGPPTAGNTELISGIVANKRVNLPAIAGKVPTMTKVDSQVKRFSRWIDNQRIDYECYYLPYAQQRLANLAHQTLVLVMDGSPVGRGCRTLMLSVVYKKRALPLA